MNKTDMETIAQSLAAEINHPSQTKQHKEEVIAALKADTAGVQVWLHNTIESHLIGKVMRTNQPQIISDFPALRNDLRERLLKKLTPATA